VVRARPVLRGQRLADGNYILETTADLADAIVESDESNNRVTVIIELTGVNSSTPNAAILGPGPRC
jgi:subtilase family serine protease